MFFRLLTGPLFTISGSDLKLESLTAWDTRLCGMGAGCKAGLCLAGWLSLCYLPDAEAGERADLGEVPIDLLNLLKRGEFAPTAIVRNSLFLPLPAPTLRVSP